MKKIKQFVTKVITAGVLLLLAGLAPVSAFANVGIPSVSSSKYIISYTYNSSGKLYAYTSASLNKKTGGYIACATDENRIIQIKEKAVQVSYPVSGGRKTAWFSRDGFTYCDLTQGAKKTFTAGKQITTYKWKGKGNTFGYIAKGDKCYLLRGSETDEWVQLLYPVSAGWKMAWIHGKDMVSNSSTNAKQKTITSFKQTDSRWSSIQYGYKDTKGTQKATIGSSGCGLLSLTNAVYYMNGSFIEPKELASYSVRNGYRINGVGTAFGLYKSFANNRGSQYKIAWVHQTGSWDTLKTDLTKGYAAICAKSGHIMTIVDYDNSTGKYLLLDSSPSSSRGTSSGYVWATKSYLQNTAGVRSDFYVIRSTK